MLARQEPLPLPELDETEPTEPLEAPAIVPEPELVETGPTEPLQASVALPEPELLETGPTEPSEAPAAPAMPTIEPGCNPEAECEVAATEKPEDGFDVLAFKVTCL